MKNKKKIFKNADILPKRFDKFLDNITREK